MTRKDVVSELSVDGDSQSMDNRKQDVESSSNKWPRNVYLGSKVKLDLENIKIAAEFMETSKYMKHMWLPTSKTRDMQAAIRLSRDDLIRDKLSEIKKEIRDEGADGAEQIMMNKTDP